jgi:hypothetical protein
MSHNSMARICLRFLVIVAAGGCTDASPVAPDAAPADAPVLSARAAAPGQYELDFSYNGELTLIATVRDAFGALAQSGAVTFQYCSKGGPRHDISNPDETSAADCANGTGSWVDLRRIEINPITGQAVLLFGAVSVVKVIGFRYTYAGPRSGIASATTEGEDWVRPL